MMYKENDWNAVGHLQLQTLEFFGGIGGGQGIGGPLCL